MATGERAPRKDVVRNRKRLLDAGREVFAAQGLSATLDDIARHAGVGAGTAYRHFGSRQEMITAIFSDVANDFIGDAESALAANDAWNGFASFVETVAGRLADDRGLHQVFTNGYDECIGREDWSTLADTITAVLDRAKSDDSMRRDVGLADVVGLFATLGPLFDISTKVSSPVWRRHVDFFLRGARNDAEPGVITAPPAARPDALAAAMGVH